MINKKSVNTYKKSGRHFEKYRPDIKSNKLKNYLPLTAVLNFLPAVKVGTVLAGIFNSLPV